MGKRKQRLWLWIRRLAIGALVAGLAGMLALWMTFQHIPAWYQPVVLNREGVRQAQADATTLADWVSERMVERRPFEVILHDGSINEWLAALPHSLPDMYRSLLGTDRQTAGHQISQPAVRFDAGEVKIGVLWAKGGWRTIIGLTMSATLSPDGTQLELALRNAHTGSLPVPEMVLRKALERFLPEVRSVRRPSNPALASLWSALRKAQSADEMLSGLKIRNRFVWPNGDRPFKITSIAIEDGEVKMRITPL